LRLLKEGNFRLVDVVAGAAHVEALVAQRIDSLRNPSGETFEDLRRTAVSIGFVAAGRQPAAS